MSAASNQTYRAQRMCKTLLPRGYNCMTRLKAAEMRAGLGK